MRRRRAETPAREWRGAARAICRRSHELQPAVAAARAAAAVDRGREGPVHQLERAFVTRRDDVLCLYMGRCCVGEGRPVAAAATPRAPSGAQIAPCTPRSARLAAPAAPAPGFAWVRGF